MDEILKQGQIKCECGNVFYFRSMREEIPCLKCGRMHDNEGEPVPEELPVEVGEGHGTDI